MRIVENWRAVLPRYTRYRTDSVDEIFYDEFKEALANRGFGES
jgi:hypothetical protein